MDCADSLPLPLRLVERLVHSSYRYEIDTLARARMLVGLTLALTMFGPVYFALFMYFGHVSGAGGTAVTTVFNLVILAMVRAGAPLFIVRHGMLGAVYSLLVYLSWSFGSGPGYGAAAWLAVIPLIATLVGGIRTGVFWLAMVMAAFWTLFGLHAAGIAVPSAPVQEMGLIAVLLMAGMIVCASLLSFIFEASRASAANAQRQQLAATESLLGDVAAQIESVGEQLALVVTAVGQQRDYAGQVEDVATRNASMAAQMAGGFAELNSHVADAQAAAGEGATTLREAIGSSLSLGNRISAAAATMTRLQARSTVIRVAAETIQRLAFQTNILALNATVEAAHAGSHGRGFAVVADSVRKLAGEAAEASQAISRELAGFGDGIQGAAESLGQGAELASIGTATAERSDQSLAGILERVSTANRLSAGMLGQVDEQRNRNAQLEASIQALRARIEEISTGAAGIDAAMTQLNRRLETVRR